MSRWSTLGSFVTCFLLARGAFAQSEPADTWTVDPPDVADPPPRPEAEPVAPPPAEEPPVQPLAPATDPKLDSAPENESKEPKLSPIQRRILHGFRMGYLYVTNFDKPTNSDDPDCPKCSLKERYGMRTPHQFLIGYEIMGRLIGQGWLNVVLVGNVLVSGLEQSKAWPSANALIGFEIDHSFQLGVGANFTLEEDKPAHMVMAAGWTPLVGSFYVPVHAFFVPDVDGNHRMGATVGVNW